MPGFAVSDRACVGGEDFGGMEKNAGIDMITSGQSYQTFPNCP